MHVIRTEQLLCRPRRSHSFMCVLHRSVASCSGYLKFVSNSQQMLYTYSTMVSRSDLNSFSNGCSNWACHCLCVHCLSSSYLALQHCTHFLFVVIVRFVVVRSYCIEFRNTTQSRISIFVVCFKQTSTLSNACCYVKCMFPRINWGNRW